MRLNHKRAEAVFGLMYARYLARMPPYNTLNEDLPQNLVREEVRADPLLLARFLFFACLYMRGTIKSNLAFRVLGELQRQDPWLFTEELLLFPDPKRVSSILLANLAWKAEEIGRSWVHNAEELARHWHGDPRNIFAGVTTKQTLYRRIMGRKYDPKGKYIGFMGFQEKMTSMLAYFLEATKLIDSTPLSAPIDFHHLRLYLSTEMIECDQSAVRYEQVKFHGIRLAEYLQRTFDISAVEYGDVMWIWSLRLCSRSPQNKTTERTDETGRIERVSVPVTWTAGERESHKRSCGSCMIADHCQHAIPAGEYYVNGKLKKIPRMSPPQGLLFSASDLPAHPPTSKREVAVHHLNQTDEVSTPEEQGSLFTGK